MTLFNDGPDERGRDSDPRSEAGADARADSGGGDF